MGAFEPGVPRATITVLVLLASALLSACVSSDGLHFDLSLLQNAALDSQRADDPHFAISDYDLSPAVTADRPSTQFDEEVIGTATTVNAFENPEPKSPRPPQLYSLGHKKPQVRLVGLYGTAQKVNLTRGAVATRLPAFKSLKGAITPVHPPSSPTFSEDDMSPPALKPKKIASAAGLARLTPNGLRKQHDKVDTACLKPELLRLLAAVRHHYGQDIVITSGFRSVSYNRRVGGVSGSRHIRCEAADIQVPGVSKWELARFLRALPGRGGVGTYCHMKSVHIDIGRKRDWNWSCKPR